VSTVSTIKRIRRSLRRRRRDERGAVLIFTAISMIALLGAGAMGVDMGFSVYGSRQAQAMADTAALDMARYINVADQGSNPVGYLNGVLTNVDTDNASNATLTEVPGLWQNGTWTPEGLNCAATSPPSTHPCNAVQVTASQAVPQIFWGGFNVLNGHAGSTLTTDRSSIAAETPESAFSIGSYLTTLGSPSQQLGVLNAILGTLGTSVNLTTAGYQGLANTYVTINQLVTASGGLLTTSDVMTTSLTGSQWLAIWSDAVANQVGQLNCGSSPTPSPCNASTALSALDFSSSTSAELCQLVSINGSSCSNGTLSTSALTAGLDAMQMLTTEAELANGTSALNVQSALGITGVTAAQLYLTLIQPPQVAYGPVGTTASTAQVQADLKLTLPTYGVLDIPLTAASGTATLKTVACQYNSMASAKIGVTTTTNTAAITLAGVSVATLSISGYGPNPQIPFSPTSVPPTASTASPPPASNPFTVPNLAPYYNVPSYNGLSTSSPAYSVLTTLAGSLVPVLQASGVAVGGAQVAYLSTNCDAVSLVQ
jgi:uncharacterized membrane protein